MTTPLLNGSKRRESLSRCAFWQIKSIHVLAERLGQTVEELRTLADRGTKNFKQYPDKKTGRWIETPQPWLKRVQKRIHLLMARLEPPPFLFSGVRKRSAVDNAKMHRGDVDIIKLDIRKFYPRSDGRRVFDFFEKHLGCSRDVAHILWKLCTITDRESEWKTHLPTGGVTSPILAYYSYLELFESLQEIAERNNLTLSVLADDITLSGENSTAAILKEAEQIIEAHGLQSNLRKRTLLAKSHPQRHITGVQISRKGYRVPTSLQKKIRVLEADLSCAIKVVERVAIYQKLAGCLAAAAQIEPKFHSWRKRVMVQWRAEKVVWEAHCRTGRERGDSRRRVKRGRKSVTCDSVSVTRRAEAVSE